MRFIIAIIALSALMIFVLWALFERGAIGPYPSFAWQTIALLALATVVIFYYLYRVDRPASFVQLYLLLTVIKLIAFLGYNILMVMRDRDGARQNVLFFLAAYFIYTFFEILFLYRHIASKSGK